MTDAPRYRVRAGSVDDAVFGDNDEDAKIWARKTLALKKHQLRAVSERIESVGGFPNQLVSASSFAPREGGGGDGCFRRSSRAGGRGGGVGRVVAQSGGRAFQSERRERRALGEAVQYHGRDFADAFRGRSALRPDRGASRL